jgi:3-oxo-5-alpha-steroid 4-dehydrogenase 1
MLYTIAIFTILIAAPVVFTVLLFFTAPYGRHFRTGWGPTVTARTGWILMEAPSLLIIAIVVFSSGTRVGPLRLLLLGLWEVHYLYRACVFPFLLRGSTRRFPIAVILFAWIFNGLNAYANGVFLAGAAPRAEGPAGRIRVAVGVALFVAGFATHVRADSTLRRLRKPGEDGYAIPRGWLFEYVASPNYLGEIMEWCGWALATWSLPGLAFALFTAANLVPRAFAHRRWYASTFPDYPPNRKNVIPFIF